MKIALAQMAMNDNVGANLQKSLQFCDLAKECDLLFFPEIQLSPFFPQYEKADASKYVMNINSTAVRKFVNKAKENEFYLSPNIYLEQNKKCYDTSLWITPNGEIEGMAKMVHIAQAKQFYEQDYYTPSDEGFKVFDTEFGKIGIVICYDRHLPESIRTCTLMGAELIIVPTANTKEEPLEMFEWEMRVQAMQNQVFIAMCNRVGVEDKMNFAGESLVIAPNGDVLAKADDSEQLLTCEIELAEASRLRSSVPYLSTRRSEWYL